MGLVIAVSKCKIFESEKRKRVDMIEWVLTESSANRRHSYIPDPAAHCRARHKLECIPALA